MTDDVQQDVDPNQKISEIMLVLDNILLEL
jgi:hypothetical protein